MRGRRHRPSKTRPLPAGDALAERGLEAETLLGPIAVADIEGPLTEARLELHGGMTGFRWHRRNREQELSVPNRFRIPLRVGACGHHDQGQRSDQSSAGAHDSSHSPGRLCARAADRRARSRTWVTLGAGRNNDAEAAAPLRKLFVTRRRPLKNPRHRFAASAGRRHRGSVLTPD
jgi:hypothetical protein